MLNYSQILLCLFCLIEAKTLVRFTDFYFESMKIINGPAKIPVHGNATVKRIDRGHPRVFLELEVTDNLRNYDQEVLVYWSPLGNRRFMLTPYKLRRQPLCDTYNTYEGKKIIRGLQNCSNIPISENLNVEFCDLLTLGHIFVRNYTLDQSTFPSMTPTGRLKFIVLVYKRKMNEVMISVEIQAAFT